jgi:hypothetical protein
MQLTQNALQAYRAKTFRTAAGLTLKTVDQAVNYINERGFILFWPTKGMLVPSLWTAVAGDRPVPDEHDDPGHVTWGWKDGLLGKQRCYYGRVLRKKNTFISMDVLPYFYALSPNYGDPNEDYLIDYEAGRLTAAAKNMYEALLSRGPLDTIALRKLAGLTSQSSNTEFNRALDELQTTFRILPVGVSEAGAWHYCFIYQILPHQFPDLIDRAHEISEAQARQKILCTYLTSVGAVPFAEIRKLFANQPHNWPVHVIERDLRKLAEAGQVFLDVECDGQKEACVMTAELAPAGE